VKSKNIDDGQFGKARAGATAIGVSRQRGKAGAHFS